TDILAPPPRRDASIRSARTAGSTTTTRCPSRKTESHTVNETAQAAGLNFDLTEEQTLLRETVRRFAEEEVAPRAMEMDRTSTFDMSLWEQMRELGLTGVPISEEFGGAGMDGL